MNANVGSVDLTLRIGLGFVILAADYYYINWWGLGGLLPLLTGSVRVCPAYVPFGLSAGRVKLP